ncbi:MAG: penicillin-binding protein activator [Pseudomonadota bacterium]
MLQRIEIAARQARRALAGIALVVAAACSTSGGGGGPEVVSRAPASGPDFEVAPPRSLDPGEARTYDDEGFVRPLHLRGEEPVRVALLLPFSAPSESAQKIASAMFDAAQLATFEAGDRRFVLIPKDTRGEPQAAAAAARSALADGAEMILGPLYAESVAAVAPVARAARTPVVAFSSDVNVAGDGVYLLSFPPEIEINRVTDYAVQSGITRFGLLAPANDFGERVANSFAQNIAVNGATLVHGERYEQDPDKMLAPAKRLAQYSKEIIPVEQRHDYDPDKDGATPEGVQLGAVQGYQAVLMPEQGTLLRALAPLLPYYNVDINRVKLLGVSAWNNPGLTREPALRGGWFAAPEPEVSEAFRRRYRDTFGANPPRLASLSYDATLLAAKLAQDPGKRRFGARAIADPNGYFGADGLFRLRRDGTVERGLAILEIQPQGIQLVDPAPRSFLPSF